MYGFLAVCYLIGIVIARRIVASPVGRILVAIRDNPLRAAAVGHNVHGYKLLAFVIAAAYAGFAGGLLGVFQGYMPPEAFTFGTSGQLIMQTVIGGLGTLFGPLVGAAVWLYLRDFLQGSLGLGATWKLALGVIFVLLVCFLRRGVIGGLRDLYMLMRHAGRKEPAADAEVEQRPAAPRRPILPPTGIPCAGSGPRAMPDRSSRPAACRSAMAGCWPTTISISPSSRASSAASSARTAPARAPSSRCSPARSIRPPAPSISKGATSPGSRSPRSASCGLTKSYQVNQLFNRLTVRENVTIAAMAEKRGSFRLDMMRHPSGIKGLPEQVEHTLQLVELGHRATVPVSDLAYGEKRRLEIGLALATSPSLLLLDEPLAGMSRGERAETVKLLKNISRGRTTIIIDHDMDALFEMAERVTVLQEGRILVEGTPDEIKANPAVQEAYLGGVLEE